MDFLTDGGSPILGYVIGEMNVFENFIFLASEAAKMKWNGLFTFKF